MRSYGSGGRARVIESIRIRINSFSFSVWHGEGLRVRFHVDFLSSLASFHYCVHHSHAAGRMRRSIRSSESHEIGQCNPDYNIVARVTIM